MSRNIHNSTYCYSLLILNSSYCISPFIHSLITNRSPNSNKSERRGRIDIEVNHQSFTTRLPLIHQPFTPKQANTCIVVFWILFDAFGSSIGRRQSLYEGSKQELAEGRSRFVRLVCREKGIHLCSWNPSIT